MPILTVVGPPGVGKSYMANALYERMGSMFATIIPMPKLGEAENAAVQPLDEEDLYNWAYHAVHNLPDTDANHLYIFDGFPIPDIWVLENKPTWTLLERNLEVRMMFKRAAQVIMLPLAWKKWTGSAIHNFGMNSEVAQNMRDNYDRYMSHTIVPGKRINVQSSTQVLIEELSKDLGIIFE